MAVDLRKSPHENERQYIWRISEAKNAGLLDMSWPEVGELFNKELRAEGEKWYNESAYRKQYQQAKGYYDDVFVNMLNEGYLEEMLQQKRELEKLKKQIQTEKTEYNKWLREEARDELIIEKITEAVNGLEPLSPPVTTLTRDEIFEEDSQSCVLAFGDAHFGAELEIKGLYGETINEYNPEIFYERMDKLLWETVGFIERNRYKEIYVYDLGDAIDGVLRVGQLMKLRYGVVESSIKYADYLATWLNELSYYCIVNFQMTGGNHSQIRHLGAKKGSFEDDNMSKVILEFLKVRLKNNPKVIISENETGMIFDTIQGYNVLGYHGESKNLEETLKDFAGIYKTNIDILLAGHLHHSFSETVGVCKDVMRTPSIIGVDDFSMKLHKTSNPGATIFVVEAGKGKVLDYHIKL